MDRSPDRELDLFDPKLQKSAQQGENRTLERILSGDRVAMSEYVILRRPLLRHRIIRTLGSAAHVDLEADDLIATLLIKLDQMVLKGSIRATSGAQLATLVTQSLESVLNDALRAKGVRRRTVETAVRLRIVRPIHGEDPTDDSREAAQKLLDAAEHLVRFDDRVLFFLVMRGLPLRDAGAALGMPPGFARVRWARIRAQARRITDQEEKKTTKSRIA